MLLFASSFGGSASLHRPGGFHRLRRGADGCPPGTRPRQRRSDLARTAAEVLVADLNRPAHGAVVGMRLDCDGIPHYVFTLLAGLRLRAAEGVAWYPLMGGIDFVGRARVNRLRVGRYPQTYGR